MPGPQFTRFFDHPRRARLALLVCTAAIYTGYFHDIVFRLNRVMSSITSDTIKNYYTYAYQVKHGESFLHFSGMQFPYGEHVVYTDCQPILTFVLRWLPFADQYSIGILHGLIFISFLLTPVVLYNVLRALQVNGFLAWTAGLGLALLAPQYLKLIGGHFGLSYTVVIPYVLLLSLRFLEHRHKTTLAGLAACNFALFWLHPYIGFGCSVFSGLLLLTGAALKRAGTRTVVIGSVVAGLLPVALFQLAMRTTDHHPQRPEQPFGLEVMVENAGSLLTPQFGPFDGILSSIFPEPTAHFEGHSYLGLANILLLFALPFLIAFKRREIPPAAFSVFIASTIFLPIAFGWHHQLLETFGIRLSAVSQFRAVCRFAWFLYFGWGVFAIVAADRLLKTFHPRAVVIAGILYLALTGVETHYYFTQFGSTFWQWRNVFNSDQVTAEENSVLRHLATSEAQAIVPLPVFHGGTEMFNRPCGPNSMLPAMILSYHSGLPLLSMMASRTSLTESKQVLEVLNTYKSERPALERFAEKPLMVFQSQDPILPCEERLWNRAAPFLRGDSIQYGMVSVADLRTPAIADRYLISPDKPVRDTSAGVVAIPTGTQPAFTKLGRAEMEVFCEIGANELKPGRYVLSLHFHYSGNSYHSVEPVVVVDESDSTQMDWVKYVPVSNFSGFYDGFGVFEWYFEIRENKRYAVLFHGAGHEENRVSHVMIRPAGRDVVTTDGRSVNNYPR